MAATPQADVASLIQPAVDAGLVVPDMKGIGTEPRRAVDGERFRFLHDRVQQAAYAMLDAQRKPAVHLMIGQQLRDSVSPVPGGERLFGISRAPERRLRAGHRSQQPSPTGDAEPRCGAAGVVSPTAHAAALRYVAAGLACLRRTAWECDYELTRDLYRIRVDAQYLGGGDWMGRSSQSTTC